VLDDRSVRPADKIQDINDYREELARQGDTGQKFARKFKDLAENIDNFVQKWEDFLQENCVEDADFKMKVVDEEISKLTDELKGVDASVKKSSYKLIAWSAVAGVTFVLGSICPIFWAGTTAAAVMAGLNGKALVDELPTYFGTSGKIKAEKYKRNNLVTLKDIQAILRENQTDFTNIHDKLLTFAGVWAAITADLNELEAKLIWIGSPSSERIFYSRLGTLKEMYRALALALDTYAKTVDSSQLPRA